MNEPGSDVVNELPRHAPQDKDVPPAELEQPDPQLSLSSGKASALQITLTAVAIAFILGVTVYGLNRPIPEPNEIAATSPARENVQETTGTAPQAQPGAGPQQNPQAQQAQPEPAQQPQPEPQKPAQPDDSQR